MIDQAALAEALADAAAPLFDEVHVHRGRFDEGGPMQPADGDRFRRLDAVTFDVEVVCAADGTPLSARVRGDEEGDTG